MIEVVFSEEVVGVGQGKKVTIIPDIQSAGDRSGGCHKVENFHPFAVSFATAPWGQHYEISQVQF